MSLVLYILNDHITHLLTLDKIDLGEIYRHLSSRIAWFAVLSLWLIAMLSTLFKPDSIWMFYWYRISFPGWDDDIIFWCPQWTLFTSLYIYFFWIFIPFFSYCNNVSILKQLWILIQHRNILYAIWLMMLQIDYGNLIISWLYWTKCTVL